MSNKIVELMQVPPNLRDTSWLQSSLQSAIELELSTIPVYLCGLWSIQSDPSGTASGLIRSVVWEEMLHMGIACNLLTALGTAPQIVSGYRNNIMYPTVGLPGGGAADPQRLSCRPDQRLCTKCLHADRDAGASADA